MWWNVGPHLGRRCAAERGEAPYKYTGRSNVEEDARRSWFKRTKDTDEFRRVLEQKFGTLTRAWRLGLDLDNSGVLDFREFCRALKHVGFKGNLRSLWYNLDTDQSGYISLHELDADAAHVLERFRYSCTSRYGSIPNTWHTLLDVDRSGTLSLPEFLPASSELGFSEEEATELFEYLVVLPACRYITLDDVMFLQDWEDRKEVTKYMSQRGTGWINRDPYIDLGKTSAVVTDTGHRTYFRHSDRVLGKFKEQLFDRRRTQLIPDPAPEFEPSHLEAARQRASSASPHHLPAKKGPAANNNLQEELFAAQKLSPSPLWPSGQLGAAGDGAAGGPSLTARGHRPKLLDENTQASGRPHSAREGPAQREHQGSSTSGGDRVRDYSKMLGKDSKDPWKEFKAFLVDRYGSLPDAFDAIDVNGNEALSLTEFQQVVNGIMKYCRMAEARRLFQAGSADGECLKWADLGISQPEWVNHKLQKRLQADQRAKLSMQSRVKTATVMHAARVQKRGHQDRNLAFEGTLPKDWGLPPTFLVEPLARDGRGATHRCSSACAAYS